ncbi:MAG: SMI1/KNR4 family protein [Tannerella sp.]|jgi:hypothetical protein|nr:SMI1/KNR4 family protein [Tannerella sp.]
MNTAEKYIAGLKKAYFDNNGKESWEHFEKIKHGASKEDISKLKKLYPDIPETLINLLEYVDGTYWREYAEEEIAFYFLGSDVEKYPYYILSSKEIVENQNIAISYYSDYIERKFEEVEIDKKITNKVDAVKWLHFSDCMNNGGTSQLFIDFSPSTNGKAGQVIRFLHDPDEFKVIADSFDIYLKMLIDNEYDFINEDTISAPKSERWHVGALINFRWFNNMKSRMTGDCHVRFRGNVGVKFPCVTRLGVSPKIMILSRHRHFSMLKKPTKDAIIMES